MKMNGLRSLFALSRFAFYTLVRERILYNIFFVAVLLLFVGYLAALLVFGRQDRVMLHFGTTINAIAVLAVATGAGSRALRSEIEERTAYLPLSRPIHRATFYFSKWFGISAFLLLNLFLLSIMHSLGIWMVAGHLSLGYFQNLSLIWIEAVLAAGAAMLFSSWLKPGLSIMCTLAYLFLGHNHEQISFLTSQERSAGWLGFIRSLTPDLSALLMDTRVFYEQALTFSEWAVRVAYGLGYGLLFVLVGNAVFYRKNI